MSATSRVTQAVVLAAGRGARMGASTLSAPKCLRVLAGRPLLAWTLDALHARGISDVLIVAGWQHQQLAGWGTDNVVNTHWATTNMVRSLQCADAWLQRANTLVVYGDGAYGAAALGAALSGPEADVLVPGDRLWRALWSLRFPDPLQDAECWRSDGRRLRAIGGRAQSLDEIEAQFMGLVRLTPAGWRMASECLQQWESSEGSHTIDCMDMTGLLGRLLHSGVSIHCQDVEGGWVEVDTEHDCTVVEHALNGPGFRHDFRR